MKALWPSARGHVTLLLIAAGLVGSVGGVPLFLILGKFGETTKGRVISREGHGAERTTFGIEGHVYEDVFPPSGHRVGQEVKVYYLPSHPWLSTTLEPRTHLPAIAPFLTWATFLCFAFFEAVWYVKEHPHIRLVSFQTATPKVGTALISAGALIGSIGRTIAVRGALDAWMVCSNILVLMGCYLMMRAAWAHHDDAPLWKSLFRERGFVLGLAVSALAILIETLRNWKS